MYPRCWASETWEIPFPFLPPFPAAFYLRKIGLMTIGAPPDSELLARAAQADEGAFRLLYERHAKRIFAFILRYTGHHHETEELLQETFLRAFRKAGEFRPEARVSTWLFQIAINLCRDRARKLPRREAALEGFREPGTGRTPADEATEAEAKRIVAEVIEGLPEDERSVFLLRVYDDHTYEEIAEAVGCSERTARERMKRGRARFLEGLQRWDLALSEVLGHGLS